MIGRISLDVVDTVCVWRYVYFSCVELNVQNQNLFLEF